MLLSLALIAACTPDGAPADRTPVYATAGAPIAGMAEGILDLPVGAPLGGYSSRCSYLGGDSKIDNRKTPYTVGFVPSVGVHTPAQAQVLWLQAGNQDLVLARIDAIYSFDGFVDVLEDRLTQDTGMDMHGKVVVATSHSHHAVANYSEQEGFYLGGDRYNREIFERITGDLEALAMEAYDSKVPAAIGIGMEKDWDPEDRVYHDRRGENDNLAFFPDIPAGSYKDPNLWVLRVDTAEGQPIGFFFDFGMHGTSLGGDNPMQSTDSIGGVMQAVQERFDSPLVIGHLQGGGGDASPSGTDDGFARLETIGEYGADAIVDLWSQTPTSTDPITMESVSRGISMARDQLTVERPYGTLEYTPYDETEGYTPDNVVYDDQGHIISPIDEFNAKYGGVFCGYDEPLLSSGTIGSTVFPYNGCMDIDIISHLVFGIFGMDVDNLELPLAHMMRANTSATYLKGVSMRTADGQDSVDNALLGFFPGETTSMYTEQFRRRALDEGGFQHTLVVGYAQDHEGYLLIPEDWLLGGYEPNITFWGPLGPEHIMEGVLQMSEERFGGDLLEPEDPTLYPTTAYEDVPLDQLAPDQTPAAGTLATSVPEGLYTPLVDHGMAVQLGPDAVLPRVQGVAQLVWQGGDPMVDSPLVVLERQDGGDWVEIKTRSGRPVGSDRTDVLLTWLPDPLYPVDAEQTHTWWAGWQAVSWGEERAGLPEGTYRLHVHGNRYPGGSTSWPWAREPYELTSEPFEVVAAQVDVQVGGGTVSAAIPAPAWGWRLVDLDGSSVGDNPLSAASLSWELADGSTVDDAAKAAVSGGRSVFAAVPPADAVAAVVTDAYGNTGRTEL